MKIIFLVVFLTIFCQQFQFLKGICDKVPPIIGGLRFQNNEIITQQRKMEIHTTLPMSTTYSLPILIESY